MDCSACGASNPGEARYCGGCGVALVLPCAECGKPVPLSNWFCGNCGAKFERGLSAGFNDQASLAAPVHLPQHLARRILDTRGLLEGERKQITVLFADIKGSTNLIEELDPEDAEQRLRPALDAMINAVHRYEGTINRVQGDGIMALFGAPLAHEDNAVRAAYAALDMQKGVAAACDADIAIRVGLHAPSITTCRSITTRSGRPCISPRAWSRWRLPARSTAPPMSCGCRKVLSRRCRSERRR
jgi:hypothetical protein